MTTILHVTQTTITGVALCVRQLATYQASQSGLSPVVACPDGPYMDSLRSSGVRVAPWEAKREPGLSMTRELRQLATLIDDIDPDIVHLHSSKAGLVGRAAVRGRRQTVMHPNAWSFLPPSRVQTAIKYWERFATRWTDLFILASEAEAATGRAAGIGGRSVIVPNGIDLSRYPPDDGMRRIEARRRLGLSSGPVVVQVGRLIEQKGQDTLLDVWPQVLDQVPDARAYLIGDGPDEARLRARRVPGINLMGSRSDVSDWLAAADVVAQPSRWEGLSYVTLETLASSRALVTFDVEGMAEATGGTAALLERDDVSGFGSHLIRYLQDPDAAAQAGACGRDHVMSRFSVEAFAQRATDASLELLTRPASLSS